jgi:hypothetical protein
MMETMNTIDTENFVPDERSRNKYSVRIFLSEIRFQNNEEELSEADKNKIAFAVKELLQSKRIIATIE